ncbi:MAG: hypothetical protein HY682_11805 [Chloroflexi bacterium]|nr:hypothetical protein [Chloroflexota bacterium]
MVDRGSGGLAEVLCALSFAADLNTGQPIEHGIKTAYIGLRLATGLGLSHDDQVAVFYASLLKDLG